ncbi:ferredoxin reductase-like protein [Atractiella rhizophila]|nr:ferredoxin reductase-like protein [Atractiella rhizophila]KAH8923455.1 ferredoxin reductase-like protein [Atractiella rhizophila]
MNKSRFLTTLLLPTLPSRAFSSTTRRAFQPSLRSLSEPVSNVPNPSGPSKTQRYLFGGFPHILGGLALGFGIVWYMEHDKPGDTTYRRFETKVLEMFGKKRVLENALSKDEWHEFVLERKQDYNHNTAIFTFSIPAHTYIDLPTASCLMVGAPGKDPNKPIVRPYTPITAPYFSDRIELMIKRYDQGKVSKHIHNLRPGETLKMKGHFPKFPYEPNKFTKIAMIAGGSGITPMFQILQTIDANPADKTQALLIFSNREERDILLRGEFEDLVKRKPDQFNVVFTLDEPPQRWGGPSGFITKDLLKSFLPGPQQGENIKIFVCGPPAQMEHISGNKKSPQDQGELKGILKELGYTEEQVYKF